MIERERLGRVHNSFSPMEMPCIVQRHTIVHCDTPRIFSPVLLIIEYFYQTIDGLNFFDNCVSSTNKQCVL